MEVAQAVVSGLLIGSVYALISVGLALIWGVMDLVNFSHGHLLMVAMYVTFFAWSLFHLDPLIGMVIAAILLAALAVAIYYLAVRPVLGGTMLSQMVVTFGLLILMQGGAQLLFTPRSRGVVGPLMEKVRIDLGGIILGGPQLAAAVVALAGLGMLWLILNRTETGMAIRAVAQDVQAAQVMGINPDRIYALTWLITGASLGIAGAMLMNFYLVDPSIGLQFGLIAFIVISLGGFGSLLGAFLAGLAMGVVQDVVGLYAPAYGLASIFLLYLIVTVIRPQGLLGTR
ncbi:MAG TPA: branched-chain amino acid ABC transporter permease [Candidatus Dormibacteraeota bacterium]